MLIRPMCEILVGLFKTSFEEHESKRPVDEVKRWEAAFTEVGTLKGWHIEGGKFDRSETEYIKDVVGYVLKKLNSNCTSVSEELVGIDDQKKMILGLIEQVDIRVIGLWGMGGIGKTTLADAVYKEVFPKFECRLFLQNISEKIKKQGNESLRNELLSKLLNEKGICIDTPSIGYPYQERLNNKKVLLVLDDVSDPDQIDFMGVKYFGPGSKIIVTSRDRQVLKNGRANRIYKVKELNENDSLQLFSTFAFKLLNPAVYFRDLSCKFVEYAQGSPLALKVLGSELYTKSKKEWESKVNKLKQCAELKISHILKSSLDELDEEENNIFLDLACIFKGQAMDYVEKVLSNCYKGATCGISKLVDKCLLENKYGCVFMHDMVEEMGKDIVMRKSECPGKRSRLWSCEDMEEVFKYDKDFVNLRKIDVESCKNLRKIPNLSGAINLELLNCSGCFSLVELPCLNHLASLHNDKLYLEGCYKLKKFPQVPSHFRSLDLLITEIEEVPDSIEHLHKLQRLSLSKSKVKNVSINISKLELLRELVLSNCPVIKFPEIPRSLTKLNLSRTQIEEVSLPFDSLCNLQNLDMSESAVKNVSIKLESLRILDLSDCPMIKFPEIPRSLIELNLSGTQIEEMSLPFDSQCNLQILNMSGSAVKNVSIKLESLRKLDLSGCPMVQFPKVPRSLTHLDLSRTQIEEVSLPFDPLSNLEYLKVRDSAVKNVSIKLESLRRLDIRGCPMAEFPEVPRGLIWLKLSDTQIEEAALSIDSLSNLKELEMSGSNIPKLQCNISLFDSREFPTVDVPPPSLRSKTLRYMWMDRCKSLKLLSELPPYLQGLSVLDCTSLEKVSFADQSLYQFDSLVDDDNYNVFCLLFGNCFNLNQESTNNIEANALLKIGSLAMKWAARYGREKRRENSGSLICCFPGNKISANKFKCQSMNSSLSFKIAPNGGSGSRFLVFSICLVADLTHCRSIGSVECICEYQLTAADGGYEKFESKISFSGAFMSKKCTGDGVIILSSASKSMKCTGDHVFILSSIKMVKRDRNYEEASFEFYIRNWDWGGGGAKVEAKKIKVERCGVHVFYVDEESEVEMRSVGTKRSFSHDGEEGDASPKRLK